MTPAHTASCLCRHGGFARRRCPPRTPAAGQEAEPPGSERAPRARPSQRPVLRQWGLRTVPKCSEAREFQGARGGHRLRSPAPHVWCWGIFRDPLLPCRARWRCRLGAPSPGGWHRVKAGADQPEHAVVPGGLGEVRRPWSCPCVKRPVGFLSSGRGVCHGRGTTRLHGRHAWLSVVSLPRSPPWIRSPRAWRNMSPSPCGGSQQKMGS